jgi:hypothetical protein
MIIENIPEDFITYNYKFLNNDLQQLSDIELKTHYIEKGYYENRLYKINLPKDFISYKYKFINNDLTKLNDNELKDHYINYGYYENRLYKINIPEDFISYNYKFLNNDLQQLSDIELKNHYISIGYYEGKLYKINLPEDFISYNYKFLNNDLKKLDSTELKNHYIYYGYYEGKLYKINLPEDFISYNYKFLNNDLKKLNDIELKNHYINTGYYENRLYKINIPEDFISYNYKFLNNDLQNIPENELKNHYINIGYYEDKIYKINLPEDFISYNYKFLNNELKNMSDIELKNHYIYYGYYEDKKYKINLPEDFIGYNYKFLNNDLKNMSDIELKIHYINYGYYENRFYKVNIPEEFDIDNYKLLNNDLSHMNNDELKIHYIKYGYYENRLYKIDIKPVDENEDPLKNNINFDDSNILISHYINNNEDNINYLNIFFNNCNVYINSNNCNIENFNINYKLYDINFNNLIKNNLIENNLDSLIINYPYISTKYIKYHKNNNINDILKNSEFDIVELSLIVNVDSFNFLIEHELKIISKNNNCINNFDCFYLTKKGLLKIKENIKLNINIFENLNIGLLTRPLFNYKYYMFEKELDSIEFKITRSNILFDSYYRVTSKWNKIYCINLALDINKKNKMEKYKNMLNCNNKFFYRGILGINLPELKDLVNMGFYKSNVLLNNKNKEIPKKGAIGLNMAQYNLFKDALKQNYEYILVLEDDISFNYNYFKILDIIFEKYNNLDILYLGCSAHIEMSKYFNLENTIYGYNIYKPLNIISEKICLGGFFAVMLSKKALNILNERFTPIDNISDVLLCDIMFDIKNDYEDKTIYKTNYNLNSLVIKDLFDVDVAKISLTENLNLSNNQLFLNNKIKYLSKLKKIHFKIDNKYNIRILITNNVHSYYKDILNIILNKFKIFEILYIKDNIDEIEYIDADIHIYSVMDGFRPKNNTLNICLNGEKDDCKENTDIAILTTKKFNFNFNIYFPHLYQSLFERRLDYNINLVNTKKYFCAYLYSYDVPYRVEIFNAVSKYKNVSAIGKSCSNIENTCRGTYNSEYTYNDLAVIKYTEYKFVLSLENGIECGYLTEKLINPILANSIPIYAGPNDIFDIINKNRIIYVYDFENFDKLNEYIQKVDTDEDLYNSILSENIFTGKITFDNFKDYLSDKIDESLGFKPRNIYLNNGDILNNYDKINFVLDNLENIDKNILKDYIGDFINDNDNIINN